MHIDLKLGLSCNNACIHCIMEPVRKQLLHKQCKTDSSKQEIESLIQSVLQQGADSVTLTGGEPTLREDFFELLQGLSQHNISIAVQTNGRLLSKSENLAKLQVLPHRNILFVIALHSNQRATHDSITRVKGSFDETIAAIRSLHEMGFQLCGKMVLSCRNLHDIRGTLALMESLGMNEAVVAFPHAEDFTPEAMQMVVPKYAEVRCALAEIPQDLSFLQKVFWETIPFCQMPSPDFYVHSVDLDFLREKLHGESTHIEMSMTGQCINWEESRKSIKAKGKCCSLCLLDKICEGVWAEYLQLHGEEDFTPISDKNLISKLWESV